MPIRKKFVVQPAPAVAVDDYSSSDDESVDLNIETPPFAEPLSPHTAFVIENSPPLAPAEEEEVLDAIENALLNGEGEPSPPPAPVADHLAERIGAVNDAVLNGELPRETGDALIEILNAQVDPPVRGVDFAVEEADDGIEYFGGEVPINGNAEVEPAVEVPELEHNCSICMTLLDEEEEREQLVWLGCGHAFHRGCIRNWFAHGHGQTYEHTCPVCRFDGLLSQPPVGSGEIVVKRVIAVEPPARPPPKKKSTAKPKRRGNGVAREDFIEAVRWTDLDDEQEIRVQQNNPKKAGSMAYDDYEEIKGCSTIGEWRHCESRWENPVDKARVRRRLFKWCFRRGYVMTDHGDSDGD